MGGDSEICYQENNLFLSDRRVMPLCILAAQYPDLFRVLDNLDDNYWKGHSKPMYSFYIKQKDIAGNPRYTEEEQTLVRMLEDGPLSLAETAHALHTDVYKLNLQRLEDEGIILRSGLTPTDMMCIRGDFTLYDAKASRLAVAFLAKSTHHTPEEIPALVYELVEKKLYKNIVRILLEDRFRKTKGYAYTDEINLLAEECFRFSKDGQDNHNHLIQARFQSDAVLVGVGAPIHVFLPEVARLLGTTCFVPQEAGVTNALGAVIGDIRAEVIDIMEEFGDECKRRHGKRIIYPSDEWYLKAGRPIPPEEFYEDFDQLENGVGMMRLYASEFLAELEKPHRIYGTKKMDVVTGEMASPLIHQMMAELHRQYPMIEVTVHTIKNKFFGGNVGVAGLVTATDIIAQCEGKLTSGTLGVPAVMLREEKDTFLDDITTDQLAQRLGVKVEVLPTSGGDEARALLRSGLHIARRRRA